MSEVKDRINKAVTESIRTRENREEFDRIQKFVSEARARGVIVERKYDLPLVDTIGSTAFRHSK